MMDFTVDDIRKKFDAATFSRAEKSVQKERVTQIRRNKDRITSIFTALNGNSYNQDILIYKTPKGVEFDGECSCVRNTDCVHVAAALIAYLKREETTETEKTEKNDSPEQKNMPDDVWQWLQRVERISSNRKKFSTESDFEAALPYRLLFVLSPDRNNRHILLSVCKARISSNGEISMASVIADVPSLLTATPSYVKNDELDLIRLFIAMRSGTMTQSTGAAIPSGKIGAQLLRELMEEGNLMWTNSFADMAKGLVFPLKTAPSQTASLFWRDEDDSTKLSWQLDPFDDEPERPNTPRKIDHILPTIPPWYVNNLACGELIVNQSKSTLSPKELQDLVSQTPLITKKDKTAISRWLIENGLNEIIPPPEYMREKLREDIKPTPCLTLGSVKQTTQYGHKIYDYAALKFDYDGEIILPTQKTPILRQKKGVMERIARNKAFETQSAQALTAFGFSPIANDSPLRGIDGALELSSQTEWLRFSNEGLTTLSIQGWRIEKQKEYRYDIVEINEWYATVDKNNSSASWFDFELGIVVDGERISLFPILIEMIRNAPYDFDADALTSRNDNDKLLAELPNGKRIALSWSRIKPILETLGELFFSETAKKRLRLSKFDAARLVELNDSVELKWEGEKEIHSLGKKLLSFGGMHKVSAPKGLNASLRDYQVEGLSWMQFLREYGFAGILADDMGLGKTIQTLAHILTEKESGRLNKPALVIAPTSLMGNWQDEAARFTPDLRVLVLQGKERSQNFKKIPDYDLIFTTYALLPRDEEILKKYEFHLIILDESQYIKNMRSKAAQIAGMLNARHRLCLTGTPLENHLGELWSQFRFLQPELLGDEKEFNVTFRNPIEKDANETRKTFLQRRIKPFLLRRTKDKVAKELPPKTEIIRSVDLSIEQRDLYETVRLAMDKKVREEITKKGVARSQIIILEALLKLRQVCCDPRLVKSVHTKNKYLSSGKLIELMEMLNELLAENRKILLFSQFTSMLAIIEGELQSRHIPYVILTGDTLDRETPIRAFQHGDVPLFLISLKAGGVGLNLTAADTVIHYDPWWNPATETQATDRAWRIGQDKPVFVYKLIANGTLEEKIQELQQKKADLAKTILSVGEVQGKVEITQEDLQAIFAPLEEDA